MQVALVSSLLVAVAHEFRKVIVHWSVYLS